VLDKKTMDRIAEIVSKHDFFILSDEIYSRILYDQEHISIASYPGLKERTIILDGFSKTYAMTGWRLGYGVMEPKLAAHVARLQTNSNSCTNSFVQKAGAAALTGSQESVKAMVAEFRRRRDHIVKGLNDLPGFTCRMPKGAFYTFPNITGTGMKSQELADALLQEAGVACLSGTSFGAHGEGYLRISYANSLENIDKALGLIGEFLTVHAKG
jgi:aspartate/methionine/tyrosine aminotransferase